MAKSTTPKYRITLKGRAQFVTLFQKILDPPLSCAWKENLPQKWVVDSCWLVSCCSWVLQVKTTTILDWFKWISRKISSFRFVYTLVWNGLLGNSIMLSSGKEQIKYSSSLSLSPGVNVPLVWVQNQLEIIQLLLITKREKLSLLESEFIPPNYVPSKWKRPKII